MSKNGKNIDETLLKNFSEEKRFTVPVKMRTKHEVESFLGDMRRWIFFGTSEYYAEFKTRDGKLLLGNAHFKKWDENSITKFSNRCLEFARLYAETGFQVNLYGIAD